MPQPWKPAIAVSCALVATAPGVNGQPLTLVAGGTPAATIVIDSARYPREDDLENQWQVLQRTIGHIAAEVADYVARSTGATLPVVDAATEAPPAEGVLLHIGRSDFVDAAVGDELPDIDPSGYVIRAVDARNLVIAGATPEGTEFGAYEFLEHFVGVRWLMPTEIGEYVPEQADLTVPADTDIRDEPAFIQVPGVAHMPTHREWARHMRFWRRIEFHHNLIRLLPPETYTATHPEFFPLLHPDDAERYLPPTNRTHGWQPCLTAPGIVEETARNIIAYLDGNPTVYSCSLGVNDSGGYCQCETCRAGYIEGEKFLGQPCYSDLYYRFCNAVVERVLAAHPDVWFGCLAYSNVGAPPVNVEVHPRIIPFLTYDTMQLLDPMRRERHEALLAAWAEKCAFLGRYDYTYGDHHVPPRIYIHHWADYVRWARDHQVRAWYAETYPFFGEAPKYYAMAKVWWHPDRDVDAILEEWYRLSFGAAAEPMQAYFDHWEDYWTRRVPQLAMFAQLQNAQYLLGNPGWLEGLETSDIETADRLVARAQELADTPGTRARVQVMALSWQYYRAVIDDYLTHSRPRAIVSVEEALALLAAPLAISSELGDLRAQMEAHPILVFSWTSSYPYGTSERTPLLDAAQTWLTASDERIAARLRDLAADDDAALAARAQTLLGIAAGSATNLTPNPGFEADDPLDGWWAGHHFGTGSVTVTEEEPHSGAHAVAVRGTWDGYAGVFRTDVAVEPGRSYLFVLRARWEGTHARGTVCGMLTQFRDAEGATLRDSLVGHRFICDDRWAAYVLETPVAPADAVTLVARVDAIAQPQTGHTVYFDDLEVYAIGQQP